MINGQRDWSPVYPVRKSMAPSTGSASKMVKTTPRRLDNEYLVVGATVVKQLRTKLAGHNMCIYIHIYICVCVCYYLLSVSVSVSVSVCVCVCVCVCVSVSLSVSVSVCVCGGNVYCN